MNEFKSYIRKVTGQELEELGFASGSLERLPLFIREGYKMTPSEFYGHQVVFVEPKGEELPTPSQLQKQVPKIESAFELPVILVFDEITYYLKEQLIKSRMAFIVPGKQLFIPFMFMDLNEQKNIKKVKSETFAPSTQCVLIYHLWLHSIEGLNFQEIADIFEYSPKTIGRCAEELKNAGACSIVGGRSKHLKFDKSKIKIWESVQDYLESPIKKVEWIFDIDNVQRTKVSGMGALSYYSNMSTGNIESLAMDAKVFNDLRNRGEISPTIYNERDVRVEVWSYNPFSVSKNEFVDPLSLYLCFREDQDERVQMELEYMLKRVLK